MPEIDTQVTIPYMAWDTANLVGRTGDAGNHTLRGLSDGVEFTPAAAPAEIDAVNWPGMYRVVIAAGENDGVVMGLGGESSTANVVIIPVYWTNHDPIDEAVWAYTTRTLTSSSTAPGTGLVEQEWTVLRGDTLERTFATIAADGSITKVQLTIKTQPGTQPDADAILAVDSTTGLIRLNGAAPGAYTATFSAVTGDLAIPAATMAQIESPKVRHYDVQVWRGAAVETIELGRFEIVADVTRLT